MQIGVISHIHYVSSRACKVFRASARKRSFLSLLFLLGIGSILSGCGSGSSSETNPIVLQLISQLEASCEQARSYEKQTTDLTAFAPQSEDSLYSPIPRIGFGSSQSGEDSTNCLLLQDLNYGLGAYYMDAAFEDQFEVEEKGDSTIATLKDEYRETTDLQRQIIVSPQEGEQILYVETHLLKRTWLYDMQIDLQLWFDSAGMYQQHTLEVQTKVLLQSPFHAQIRGKLNY